MVVNAQGVMKGWAVADTHLGTPEFSCTVEYKRTPRRRRPARSSFDSPLVGLPSRSSGPAPAGSLKMSEDEGESLPPA
jgi:hypothetical protein